MSKLPNVVGLIKCENEEQKAILKDIQDSFCWFRIFEITEHTNFIINALQKLKEHDNEAITDEYLKEVSFYLNIVNKVMISMYYLLRPFK